jgi:rRNA maturation endonuclease Nob1
MILAALPDGAIPLAVGTVLALGGLTLVLSPLIGEDTDDAEREASSTSRPTRNHRTASSQDGKDIPSDSGVVALREIEFDRETGKLSDSDYLDLKQRYTKIALDEMRAARERDALGAVPPVDAVASAAAGAVLDPVEAAIQRAREAQRACEVCGPRPEPDAAYCSSCGRYLAGACGECGTPVELVGSHFCTNCGQNLAAV